MDEATALKNCGYIMGVSLAEGCYGKVKSAYSNQYKAHVAVKIIDKKKADNNYLEKFLPREMEILALVNHKNIVKTYEIFESSDEKIYIIMELAVNGNLLQYLKSRGSLPEDRSQKMFRQLAMAMKYCHDINIVHRDLKCENVLLDINYNIKLSDFGFSKQCAYDEDGSILLSKTFCGSVAYTAPEVLEGIPYDPKVSDIWSMGVVLFVMVCDHWPYDDSNIQQMVSTQKMHTVDFRSKCVTSECKDLIIHILHPNVLKRLTIEKILAHTWMQSTNSESTHRKKAAECFQTVHQQEEQPNGSKLQNKGNNKTEAKSKATQCKNESKPDKEKWQGRKKAQSPNPITKGIKKGLKRD
ncbi:testis-specific serine/threonine-protein kinase 1-like [Protopterus annectens]|uniref:testis-specific serine/threonine-protein kinase 1-like n=1 Tax=Protopterus annectens TaxID=7888 RepID=UPI001CFB9204|nr:testis-specific serine/threonine-protein kinase 1-like [Protopterus annectens]